MKARKKTMVIGGFAAALLVGIGTGTATALWSAHEQVGFEVQSATLNWNTTNDGTTKRQVDKDGVTFTFGGPAAAQQLVNDGYWFKSFKVEGQAIGEMRAVGELSVSELSDGVFSNSEMKLIPMSTGQTCNQALYDAAPVPTPSENPLWSDIIKDESPQHDWNQVTAYDLCLGFKLGGDAYTSTATVTGATNNGATVNATDTWNATLIPDPANEPEFTVLSRAWFEAPVCGGGFET